MKLSLASEAERRLLLTPQAPIRGRRSSVAVEHLVREISPIVNEAIRVHIDGLNVIEYPTSNDDDDENYIFENEDLVNYVAEQDNQDLLTDDEEELAFYDEPAIDDNQKNMQSSASDDDSLAMDENNMQFDLNEVGENN